MDTAPPDVIKLKPGEAMTFARFLDTHPPAVCKVKTVRFETKFRFRLEYFDNEKDARAYAHRLPSRTEELEVRPQTAISETFEIPLPPEEEQ